jgi:hypothetical protein
MKNQELPNAQTSSFASMVYEVNRFKVTDKLELWFFIQEEEGDYPYHLLEFDCENNVFNFKKTITTRVQFINLLES